MNLETSREHSIRKRIYFLGTFASMFVFAAVNGPTLQGDDRDSLIILDDVSASNLGIQTVEVEYSAFTETLFAIGRIEPVPSRKSVVSSRIAGRVTSIHAFEGDIVEADSPIVEIESLQPGNPPPRIELRTQLPGMVMRNHTHVGIPVMPDNELFEVVDLSEVHAVARIPEDQAGKLEIGAQARISIAALSGEHYEGRLVRFGTEANPVNGTLDAFFLIQNPDYKARPNMRAEFSIALSTRSNTMSVPRSAIQTDGIQPIVFVKDFDLPNAFIKSPVRIGEQNESRAEILSGLFPGDEVVTRGSYSLLFAQGGSLSLKEALDAAHGHEHNEDGSEMTAAQRTERQAQSQPAGDQGQLVMFLSILCGLLVVILAFSIWLRRASPTGN